MPADGGLPKSRAAQEEREPPSFLAAGLAIAVGILLVIVGVACLVALGLVPYQWVRRWLDQFAADGSADAYTPAVHRTIFTRLRYVGLAGIALGALVLAMRRRFAGVPGKLAAAFAGLVRDLGAAARRLWAEEPAGHWVTLLAVLAAGLVVRVELLGWPMRYDEAYTFLNYARDPLVLGLTRYDAPNNHLFHTFLVHVAYRLFGAAPWALRLPALLAGLVVLPASYVAVRVLYGSRAALVATAMIAMSMSAIEMSTNARGYSIVTLLFLLLVSLGAHLGPSGNAAGWILFAALAAAGLYTIPVMLYALAAVVAWLLLSAWMGDLPEDRRWPFTRQLAWTLLATGLTAGVLYLPILIRTDLATLLSNPIVSLKVQPVPWAAFVVDSANGGADTWQRWASDLPRWLQAIWLIGIATAIICHRRLGRTRVSFAAGVLLGSAPVVLLQRTVPPSRVWIFLLPIGAGMGAAGVLYLFERAIPRPWTTLGGRGVAAGLALLLALVGTMSVPARSPHYRYNLRDFPDAEPAVVFLAPRLEPGDRVLVLGRSLIPFLYYCHRHGLPCLRYVHDSVLESWEVLGQARRIFIVVNERWHTLDDVLTEARLPATPPPAAVAAFAEGHVYLLTRD